MHALDQLKTKSSNKCNNGGKVKIVRQINGRVSCVIFDATKIMLIGLSNGYIKPLNAKTMQSANYVSGKNITIAIPQNPRGHTETCLRHITAGCSSSTQSEMTDIVLVSNHMLMFSLKLHNPYTGFTPIMHDCTIYYTEQGLTLLKNTD